MLLFLLGFRANSSSSRIVVLLAHNDIIARSSGSCRFGGSREQLLLHLLLEEPLLQLEPLFLRELLLRFVSLAIVLLLLVFVVFVVVTTTSSASLGLRGEHGWR